MHPRTSHAHSKGQIWAVISAVAAVLALVPAYSIFFVNEEDPNDDETETESTPAAPSAIPVDQATLVWSDEFDGPAGSAPDPSKWGHDTGGSGWGNEERQYYTSSTENVAHNGNGSLAITALDDNAENLECWYGTCEYTSGKLTTAETFTQQYGRFEVRAKMPLGQGLWPEVWMLGENIDDVDWPNCGEIDILHISAEPHTVTGVIHGPGYSVDEAISAEYSLPEGETFADTFHTFAIDWSPGTITWSVDGETYAQVNSADLRGGEWVFDQPFYLNLKLAVGGTVPGPPDTTTQFPQQLLVDYVRVYAPGEANG
ncbi:glycoside hydrolase family 16 protein [Glycomyces halotolerans]